MKLPSRYTMILGVVLFIVFLALLAPKMGRVTPESVKKIRTYELRAWYDRTNLFIQTYQRLPSSLFEVYNAPISSGVVRLKIHEKNTPSLNQKRLCSDSIYFLENIDYRPTLSGVLQRT